MRYDTIISEVMKETNTKQRALASVLGVGQPAISNIFTRKDKGGIQLNKLLDILDAMGYEVVVQKKMQGRRKDGQMLVTKEE